MWNYNKSIQKILFVLSCLYFFCGVSLSVNANSTDTAEKLVVGLSSEIIDIVESKKSNQNKQKRLYDLFDKNANVTLIARAALGARWRTISQEKRNMFSLAFTGYLIKKYAQQFDEFKGAKMVMERSIDAGKRGIVVNTRFLMPGSAPISVKWQLWSKTEELKLIDIIIEDISMLTMEREEIKNRLASHNGVIDELISELNDF